MMDWAHGFKIASIIMGISLGMVGAILFLISTIGGWALIVVLVAMFAAIAICEAGGR